MSGLAVAQHALAVTAHNVANVNTEGYSASWRSGGGDPRRARRRRPGRHRPGVDEFLAARLQQQGRLGRSEALSEVHGQIQARCSARPATIAACPAGSRPSRPRPRPWPAAPDQPALARAFVGAAQDLTGEIAAAGAEVQGLRGELDQRLARTVGEINAELRALDQLNRQIVARGGASAELLDRRDALLESLAAKIEISVSREDSDAVAVYTRAGGQPLLEGTRLGSSSTSRRRSWRAAPASPPIRLFHADDVDPATGAPPGRSAACWSRAACAPSSRPSSWPTPPPTPRS